MLKFEGHSVSGGGYLLLRNKLHFVTLHSRHSYLRKLKKTNNIVGKRWLYLLYKTKTKPPSLSPLIKSSNCSTRRHSSHLRILLGFASPPTTHPRDIVLRLPIPSGCIVEFATRRIFCAQISEVYHLHPITHGYLIRICEFPQSM